MAEQLWLIAISGGARLALSVEETIVVMDNPPLRPLPGGRSWCTGWVTFQDHFVPVLGGDVYGHLGKPAVLLVVELQGTLLGLPCQDVTLLKGVLCDNIGVANEAGLPVAGAVEVQETGAALRPDLQKLYSVLGIQ